MANAGARTRAVAAEIVDAVVRKGQSLDAAIAAHEVHLPPGDRSLLRMLSYGVVRHQFRLQEWIDALVSRNGRLEANPLCMSARDALVRDAEGERFRAVGPPSVPPQRRSATGADQ